MEEKTIVEWEKEKSNTSSRPVGSRMPTEEHAEPTEYEPGVGVRSVRDQLGGGVRRGVGSDKEEDVHDTDPDEKITEGEEEGPSEPIEETRGR